jgi:hypothetical protein
MASAELSRRIEKVAANPPLSELDRPANTSVGSRAGKQIETERADELPNSDPH